MAIDLYGMGIGLPIAAQTPHTILGKEINRQLLDQSIQGDTTQQEMSALKPLEMEEMHDDDSIKNDSQKQMLSYMKVTRPRELLGKVSSKVKSRLSSHMDDHGETDLVVDDHYEDDMQSNLN